MKKYIYFLLGTAILFSACQQDMVIDLPPAVAKVTVNTFLKTDSVFNLNLSKSRGPLEDSYDIKYIDSARVEIIQGTTVIDSLISLGSGYYVGTKMPVQGATYALRVVAAGFPEVTAIETIPLSSVFSNVTIQDSVSYSQNEGYQAEITLTLNDPAGIDNYYGIGLQSVDTIFDYPDFGDTVTYLRELYYSSLDPLLGDGGFFDDKAFDGTARQFKIQISEYNLRPGSPLFLNVIAVSKKGFDYQKTLNKHLNVQGNPFAEPVQVYSNILDGYGIFIGAVPNEIQIR